MKTKLLIYICSMINSCYNGNEHQREIEYINENTVVFDMERIKPIDMKLSDIIADVKYLELDNRIEAILSNPQKVLIIDSLVYVSDRESNLKCFNKISGEYIRDCIQKGRARNEVIEIADFDVDKDYLYVLDAMGSKLVYFNHSGDFIKTDDMPYKAQRVKAVDEGFVFNLSPLAFNDKDQEYQIGVSDKEYNLINLYFPYYSRMVRTPYFTQGYNDCFAPIFGFGIYSIKNHALTMDYYLKFKEDIMSKNEKGSEIMKYADRKNLMYIYNNPICGEKYILQHLYTSQQLNGNLIIDKTQNDISLVKSFVYDTGSIPVNFSFNNIQGYSLFDDAYFGIMEQAKIGFASQSEIDKQRAVLDKKSQDILIKDVNETQNVLLFFLRLK